jgi:hypothetical protein
LEIIRASDGQQQRQQQRGERGGGRGSAGHGGNGGAAREGRERAGAGRGAVVVVQKKARVATAHN